MLAKGVAQMAMEKAGGIKTVAVSGGCYQNKLLLSLTEKELKDNGFKVLRHQLVPPNDGGIALGQALYGMNKISNKEDK
jgi:hydrogenase maturation protein HypF